MFKNKYFTKKQLEEYKEKQKINMEINKEKINEYFEHIEDNNKIIFVLSSSDDETDEE